MRRQIVVPLDGSPLAEGILPHVTSLARSTGAGITLLSVLHPLSDPNRIGYSADRETATAYLELVARDLARRDVEATFALQWGHPETAIVRYALRHPTLFVAMSTHGRTGLDRWARGSVAEEVLRHARRPVFLANPRGVESGKAAEEPRYGRILVALDGSEASARILPTVAWIARMSRAEVILLYCIESYTVRLNAAVDQVLPRIEEGEERMRGFRERLERRGIRVHLRIKYDPPATAILETAAQEDAHLVAMTTHGRTGLRRLLTGSVAETVLRACPRPILILRSVRSPVEVTEGEPAPLQTWS